MKFDFEKLKKIPIFKNVDFEDPRSRRRVGMAFLAFALVLIVLVVNLIPTSGKPETSAETAQDERPLLEIPQGQDKDAVLQSEDMIEARSRLAPGNRNIFEESERVNDVNPLAMFTEQDSAPLDTAMLAETQSTEGNTPFEESDNRESRRRRALSVFGLEDDDHVTPETSKDASETKPAKEDRRKRAEEAFGMGSGGSAPQQRTTPATASSAKPKAAAPKKTTPQTNRGPATAMAEPQAQPVDEEPEPVKVRRSGGVQSLGGDFYTIEGISSLDTESQYVTEDKDHPYRVTFTRSQKIRSGDRVSLRILEDMVVGDLLIPKNTHLYGTCTVSDRLRITVSSIEINKKFYSLGYSAYDSDGGEGIYCPDSNAAQVIDQTSQQVISSAASTAATAASSAMGSLGAMSIGSTVGALTNAGARLISGKGGATVEVNSGYVFYLLKD